MQAPDVTDNPRLRIQAQGLAGLRAWHQGRLQGVDVDAVVQGLDTLCRPLRQTAAHVVTHCIRHAQQAQAFAEQVGEDASPLALVVTESMVHADHRQAGAQQRHVDRLEAMGNAEGEIALGRDPPQCTDGAEFQATHSLGAELQEQHLVRRAAGRYLRVGGAGEEHRGDLVATPLEQAGVLTGAVQERPVIAMAELQDARFRAAGHTGPRRPSQPGCLP
ncbi:hypothetical protein D3C80_1311080 [compost metagenome]